MTRPGAKPVRPIWVLLAFLALIGIVLPLLPYWSFSLLFRPARCRFPQGTLDDSPVVPEGLDILVAKEIIDDRLEESSRGYPGPEGAIIALINTLSEPPVRVWRYENGQLVDATAEDFSKALYGSRSDWPPLTYYFRFYAVTHSCACVDVSLEYDVGITETSRGGHAEIWQLRRTRIGWIVQGKEAYFFWD